VKSERRDKAWARSNILLFGIVNHIQHRVGKVSVSPRPPTVSRRFRRLFDP
jgi:hypothetical protein